MYNLIKFGFVKCVIFKRKEYIRNNFWKKFYVKFKILIYYQINLFDFEFLFQDGF